MSRYHCLVLANWSHMDLWHLALNMYVCFNFGSVVHSTMGAAPFCAIYGAAGLAGSLASVAWHSLSAVPHFSSLGASASLLGVIVCFAMYDPEARFKVVFDVSGYLTFSAWHGVLGLVALDCVGLALRWRFLDHAAHLAGAATGFAGWTAIRHRRGFGRGSAAQGDMLCIDGKYLFAGDFDEYRKAAGEGTIHSPTKTYRGQLGLGDAFSFHGRGALRNEVDGSVFYGDFERGHVAGVGLLCWENGQVFPAEYENKAFRVPRNFEPGELLRLIRNQEALAPLLSEEEQERKGD